MSKMIKTSNEICEKCKYHTGGKNTTISVCYYYVITNKRRGCKVGECDNFEEGASLINDDDI